MAIAAGQHAKGQTGSGSSATSTAVDTTASGSTFYVFMQYSGTFSSVTDSKSNTYTIVGAEGALAGGSHFLKGVQWIEWVTLAGVLFHSRRILFASVLALMTVCASSFAYTKVLTGHSYTTLKVSGKQAAAKSLMKFVEWTKP